MSLAARYQSLAPRERRALTLGAIALLLVFTYLLAWEPLLRSRDAWRVRVAAAEADLAWMRAAAPRVQAAAGTAPATAAPDGRSPPARCASPSSKPASMR